MRLNQRFPSMTHFSGSRFDQLLNYAPFSSSSRSLSDSLLALRPNYLSMLDKVFGDDENAEICGTEQNSNERDKSNTYTDDSDHLLTYSSSFWYTAARADSKPRLRKDEHSKMFKYFS